MEGEFDDLRPMFVAEARQRLERLTDLLSSAEGDPGALLEVRRELHTVKGAARMLQLTAIAEECHEAEEMLSAPRPDIRRELSRRLDRLSRLLEEAARGTVEDAAGPAGRAQEGSSEGRGPATPSELLVSTAIVDALSDRAIRLRILALGAGQFVERLYRLARLAEKGATEGEAVQVLPVLSATLRLLGAELEAGQRRLARTTEAHLEALLELQVQPLKGFLRSLARHAREIARGLHREIEVELKGEETRLDRRIVRLLEEALLHLVRNAVDHGIEPADARIAAGKPAAGRLRIEAAARGDRVRLLVADDGAGIDLDAVQQAAVRRGLAQAGQVLEVEQALRLLFVPGFSTREEVSELSGRGVGLDVVAAAVSRLGGEVNLDSKPGEGTSFSLEVPATRQGEEILLLRVGKLRFGVPSATVRSFEWLFPRQVTERDGRFLALTADVPVPFVPLASLFGETPVEPQILVHASAAGDTLAVAVDAVEGTQEVLIRPVPRLAGAPEVVEGVALLPSGEPLAVLSPVVLARLALAGTAEIDPATFRAAQRRPLRVLLVDDSLVTREMERRLLEDAGFEVAVAGDAEEALATVGGAGFDCVVTDIEMPGMDGFELTRTLRSMAQMAQTPIVVVSTRDRPEDRLEGLAAGADAYLTKQGLDPGQLARLVRRLGGS